jgi:hypothetical protein
LCYRIRKWEPDTPDLWNLAEEIAHFITDGVAGGATVLCGAALRDNYETEIICKFLDGNPSP